MVIAAPGAAAVRAANHLRGLITEIVNLGAELHYAVNRVDGRITVVIHDRGQERLGLGDQVSIIFQRGDCIVLPNPKSRS